MEFIKKIHIISNNNLIFLHVLKIVHSTNTIRLLYLTQNVYNFFGQPHFSTLNWLI